MHSVRFLNVARGLPGKFYLITVNVCAFGLGVAAFDNVSVSKVPGAVSLRLVVTEVAFEEGSVGVDPFSRDNHSVLEFAYILLFGLVEDIGALAFFLSVDPVSRIHVVIRVVHYTFTVALSVCPVAVVMADPDVVLSANA